MGRLGIAIAALRVDDHSGLSPRPLEGIFCEELAERPRLVGEVRCGYRRKLRVQARENAAQNGLACCADVSRKIV